jgi:hypothetical protein
MDLKIEEASRAFLTTFHRCVNASIKSQDKHHEKRLPFRLNYNCGFRGKDEILLGWGLAMGS